MSQETIETAAGIRKPLAGRSRIAVLVWTVIARPTFARAGCHAVAPSLQ
jgi:hypothetical protein